MVAAFCVPINQGFFLNAARLGPNSHVGLFYAVCPLVVWVLAWMLGQEKLDLRRLWGVLASIAGVGVIGLGNLWGGHGASAAESRSIMLADLLLVGAVLSWGAYLTLSKPLITRHGALPVLAGTFLVGFLLELPIALFTLPGWLPMLGRRFVGAWVSLAILALLITPLNLALQNLSLRRLDASQVATFSNVAPVLTVVWGVWFFHESLSPAPDRRRPPDARRGYLDQPAGQPSSGCMHGQAPERSRTCGTTRAMGILGHPSGSGRFAGPRGNRRIA